jgi:hypothetical protein
VIVIVKIKMIPPRLLVKVGVSLAEVVPNVLVARVEVIVGKVWGVPNFKAALENFVRVRRLQNARSKVIHQVVALVESVILV